jgi:hypothetical protein
VDGVHGWGNESIILNPAVRIAAKKRKRRKIKQKRLFGRDDRFHPEVKLFTATISRHFSGFVAFALFRGYSTAVFRIIAVSAGIWPVKRIADRLGRSATVRR